MSLEAIVGYHFKNPSLLKEAMQTPGFQTKGSSGLRNQRSTASFPVDCDHRRLAIIGDKVLGLALASDWYSGGGSRNEFGNNMPMVTSNHNLSNVGLQMGLDKFMVHDPTQQRTLSPSSVATAIEAVLGAVWQDCEDLETLKRVIEKLKLDDYKR